jgi:DNA-binding beta-propeller fold protein YncE
VLVTVPPQHRLIEGVASDGRRIWVSSVIDRQILECSTTCRTFARIPGNQHPFAISWDTKRKRLWVAADCPPGVSFINACEEGALIGLDGRGRIQTRISAATRPFHPGDVSAANGEVFVSDSQSGAVYRLSKSGHALSALVPMKVGKSAQGSALSADGKRLLVADYSQGITAIDLATGKRTLFPGQDGKSLRGIDGVVRCGNTYLGVYNGVSPGALLSLKLGESSIEYGELIDDLSLPDPTQVAFDGKRVLVVANAGWELAGKGQQRNEGTPILAIPVDQDCRPR